MKMIFLILSLTPCAFIAKAQWSMGGNIGIPVGAYKGISALSFGAELQYEFSSTSNFDLGFVAGIQHYAVKKPTSDVSFIPIAGTVTYLLSKNTFIGTAFGYGVSLSPPGVNGGLYYRPAIGYYLGTVIKLTIFYSGFAFGGTQAENFGLAFYFRSTI